MTRIVRHVFISGRVQGVCFRHYTRKTAQAYGVDGWVRNLTDGRVEALFSGEKEGVEATLAWCHEGPEIARVDAVEVQEEAPSYSETGFKIR